MPYFLYECRWFLTILAAFIGEIKNRVFHWFYKNTFEIPPKTLYSKSRSWLKKTYQKPPYPESCSESSLRHVHCAELAEYFSIQ
jgi:hypothetical protein